MKLYRAALLGAVLLLPACGGGDENQEANAPSVEIDTTNSEPMDGSSTQQVQAQAEALTPEQAAQRGLVDTTIHLENLSSSDSTPPGATNQAPVNPGAQATARTDTAPPAPETNP
jgi:hypothetical protein